MPPTDGDQITIILGIARALVLVVLVTLVFMVVRRGDFRRNRGWTLISAGFVILAISAVIGALGYFPEFNKSMSLEKGVAIELIDEAGTFAGFLFLLIGMTIWLPYVNRLGEARKRLQQTAVDQYADLEETNAALRREIEERWKADMALRDSEREVLDILDNISDTFYRVDADGRVLMVSRSIVDLLGYDPDEVIGTRMADYYVNPEERKELLRILEENGGRTVGFETAMYRKDGSKIWISTSAHYYRDGDGNVQGVEGIARNITEQKNKEGQLSLLAHHDPLTGLANRRMFDEAMPQAMARVERNKDLGAVLYCDLDFFKEANDSLGHDFGDWMLQEAARRIKANVRENDLVARVGGDEFTLILENMHSNDLAETVAAKLLEALSEPYQRDQHIADIGVSIGVAYFDGRFPKADELVNRADRAMYRAKRDGRGAFRVYDPALDDCMVS
ncbi:MAG: sensor domain-containing diguanylate cyclase [Rhodospirillales bacterium]|nr:sensor domain-containing diguanylate cyclase [Rhodospirillales bacterium]